MPKEIGKTLKEFRISSKISVKEISDRLTQKGYKASESTIYSWENGNSSPTPGALLEMCDIYGIKDILRAFGYDGYNEDGSIRLTMYEIELVEKYRKLDKDGKKHIDSAIDWESDRTEQLHSYEEKLAAMKEPAANIIELQQHRTSHEVNYFHSVSAGSGIFILGNEAVDKIKIPDIPQFAKADYAIDVSGDSMEPDYHDGDVVLVSRDAEMRHGDVGIFVVNGNAYIKEYGETELISRNPACDNIPILDSDNIVCMGKVIGKL